MVEWTRVHQLGKEIIEEGFDKGLYKDKKGAFITMILEQEYSSTTRKVLTNKHNSFLKNCVTLHHCKSMNNSKALVDTLIHTEHNLNLTSDTTRLQARPVVGGYTQQRIAWICILYSFFRCLLLVLPNVFVSHTSKARLTCPSA